MKLVLFLPALSLLTAFHGVVHADPLLKRLRDEYIASKPWSMKLRTITIGDSDRAVAAEIVVGDQTCSGSFSGLGKSDGRSLQIRSYKPSSADEQQCVVSVELDKTGKVATVTESGCQSFHGAQCEFAGTLVAK